MATSSITDEKTRYLTEHNFRFLCETVYEGSGIVLDESKGYLVEARLTPVAESEGADSLDELCNLIRATDGLRVRKRVIEAMTTNETLFFRDVTPFDALRNHVIPDLLKRRGAGRPLRVWSAACSTGQEPYSLAMMWLEMGLPPAGINILGTDLADLVLEKARNGRYLQLEVNRGLPATCLIKYFTRCGMEWEIKPAIRDMVKWKKFNLKDRHDSLGEFDIVMCRNVLIYFDAETKKNILAEIRKVLAPQGYLLLGSSETTLNLDDNYRRRQAGSGIVYQTPGQPPAGSGQ